MCGRYEAGQKQKIAEAFHVLVTLDDIYFGLGVECAPGSIQPVIYVKDGERQVGEMRWGFKLPDRLLFNARSESMTSSSFWRERLHRRCIVPAASFFEWQKTAPEPRPNRGRSTGSRSKAGPCWGWLGFGDLGRIRRPADGKIRLQASPAIRTRRWARFTIGSLSSWSRESMQSGWRIARGRRFIFCGCCRRRIWLF